MNSHRRPEAVILARVSSREQEAEGYSLPAQIKLQTEYCGRKGLSIKKTFSIAESASGKRQREVFDQMMTYIDHHQVKHFVVEKVDRLTRNFKDAVMIDDWLEADEERRVHLVKDSLIMHKNSRSQEKLNWGVRIIFAKNYIDNLKEEVDKGMKEKLAQGWLPGTPPLGYKTIGEAGKRIHVIDEESSHLILKMFELYASGGYSLLTLTHEMRRLGLVTRRGRPLVKSHIVKMLSHPFYTGKNPWKGQIYPGNHTPIINDELFDEVRNRMQRKNAPRYRTHNHVFKGLLLCDECGGIMTWETQKDKWYGRCKGQGKGCTRKKYAKREDIEDQLITHMDVLKAPSAAIIEWVTDALRAKHQTSMDAHNKIVNQLQARKLDLSRRIDLYYDDRVVGRITPEKYDQKVLSTDQEIKDVDDRLGNLQRNYMNSLDADLELLDICQHAADIYKSKTDFERRKLLGDIFSNLSLNGNTLRYSYTKTARAIAMLAEEDRKLHEKFELTNNGSTEAKEALIGASRSIWLGLWDVIRTNIGNELTA